MNKHYTPVMLADRIREAREGAKSEKTGRAMSQDELAEKLGIKNRNTISRWEDPLKQNNVPKASDLIRMCEIFNCDMGYLFGEYEGKTREEADMKVATGLSEVAINELICSLPMREHKHYSVDLCSEFIEAGRGEEKETGQMWRDISSLIDYMAGYKLPDMSTPGNTLNSDMLFVESGLYFRCQQIIMGFIEKMVEKAKQRRGGAGNA